VAAAATFGPVRFLLGLTFVLSNCFVIPFTLNACGADIGYIVMLALAYMIVLIAFAPVYVGSAALIASIFFACYMHKDAVVFRKLPVYDKDLAALERRVITEGEPALKALGVKMYKVPREMSLKEVAAEKDVYGDPLKWDFIYKANKSRVDGPESRVPAGVSLIVAPLPVVDPMNFVKLGFWFVAGALVAFCWRVLVGKMFKLFTMTSADSSRIVKREMGELQGELDSARREFKLLKEEISLQIIEMNKITGFRK
jgi:hypothetical protein